MLAIPSFQHREPITRHIYTFVPINSSIEKDRLQWLRVKDRTLLDQISVSMQKDFEAWKSN